MISPELDDMYPFLPREEYEAVLEEARARALKWESDRPGFEPRPIPASMGPLPNLFSHLQNEDNSGPCLWAY